jgi:hypothetical protein
LWMKTSGFDRLEDGMKQAAYEIFDTLILHKQQEEMQAAMQQEQMAQSLGMANASTPQREAPTPDQRMPELPEAT